MGQWLAWMMSHIQLSTALMRELAIEVEICLRMTPGNSENFLELVSPKTKREDMLIRGFISARVKLKMTLNCFATGIQQQRMTILPSTTFN